jgi:nucleotide-binding universal stress UspA family protein
VDADKPILIAYDGSGDAKAAIESAGALFPGRRAVVLSAWHSLAASAPASLLAIPAAVAAKAYADLDNEAERQAVAQAEQGAAEARAAGLDARGRGELCIGQVWTAIVNAAEEEDAAAIVVGSRGRSGVTAAVMGSVSSGVAHHASRPVVVNPPVRRES